MFYLNFKITFWNIASLRTTQQGMSLHNDPVIFLLIGIFIRGKVEFYSDLTNFPWIFSHDFCDSAGTAINGEWMFPCCNTHNSEYTTPQSRSHQIGWREVFAFPLLSIGASVVITLPDLRWVISVLRSPRYFVSAVSIIKIFVYLVFPLWYFVLLRDPLRLIFFTTKVITKVN